MKIKNYLNRIEYFIYPFIPIIFIIIYLLGINENKEVQNIFSFIALCTGLLGLYFYMYQSKSVLLNILLGLTSLIFIGSILTMFNIKGASLILLFGTLFEKLTGPIIIGIIIYKYKTEVIEIRKILLLILIILIFSNAYSIFFSLRDVDSKIIVIFSNLLLLAFTSMIVLNKRFVYFNDFIQTSIKSIFFLQLFTFCILVVLN